MTAPISALFPGVGLQNGSIEAMASAEGLRNYVAGITALSGGAQVGAPVLLAGINTITTVAGANDSVQLPRSQPGKNLIVVNTTATAVQMFANTTSSLPSGTQDTINGTAGATGVSLGANATALLISTAYGAWVGPVALA
jgi:hypothetical protein